MVFGMQAERGDSVSCFILGMVVQSLFGADQSFSNEDLSHACIMTGGISGDRNKVVNSSPILSWKLEASGLLIIS